MCRNLEKRRLTSVCTVNSVVDIIYVYDEHHHML